MNYKSQSILSKVGYNPNRNISTSFASNSITNSLDFNPFNPFNSFDNFEYDEIDPMTKMLDTTHAYVPTIQEKIVNFNALYTANPQNPKLEMICNSILDQLNDEFGFKLGLDTNNNVRLLQYILNNALNIIQFIITATANELIKQMVRNTNSIKRENKPTKVNHTYKIAFNVLQSNTKTTEFINAFDRIKTADKSPIRTSIIAKLKNKNITVIIFTENDIEVICKTLIAITGIDVEEIHQELLYIALDKAQKI